MAGEVALSQFDTPKYYADLVADAIRSRPGSVIDLGAGSGNLLLAAADKWSGAVLVACEVDKARIALLRSRLPDALVMQSDIVSDRSDKWQFGAACSFDAAVCNPPFGKVENTDFRSEWLHRAGFGYYARWKLLPIELVFLVRNLVALKPRGELGIILPMGVLTSVRYRQLRRVLFGQHKVSRIFAIPSGAFDKTEAACVLLEVKKGCGPTIRVEVVSGRRRRVVRSFEALVERADPEFFLEAQSDSGALLSDIAPNLKRGARTSKELAAISGAAVDSGVVFRNHGRYIGTSARWESGCGEPEAEAGDILVVRVGTRVLGKVAMITKGRFALSDCVVRIRVESRYRQRLFEALKSSAGQDWLLKQQRGVCAKYITYSDILSFPLEI